MEIIIILIQLHRPPVERYRRPLVDTSMVLAPYTQTHTRHAFVTVASLRSINPTPWSDQFSCICNTRYSFELVPYGKGYLRLVCVCSVCQWEAWVCTWILTGFHMGMWWACALFILVYREYAVLCLSSIDGVSRERERQEWVVNIFIQNLWMINC